ncbi:MAG: hypothetical protein ACKVOJ_06665 [Sphingomonadaceae bacterium]
MKTLTLKTTLSGLIAALAMIGATLPTTASAQAGAVTFTFTSNSNAPTMLGGNGKNGVPYSGMHWTGSSTGKTSTGEATKTSFSCVMMTQPPRDSLFEAHMLCDITASDGGYSATMGCQFIDAAKGEVSCIGGLYGTSGTYAGRRGSITNHAKGSASTGTGQWFQ